MNAVVIQRRTPLSKDEIYFLRRKERVERKQFYRVVRMLLLLCFSCPFVVAWIRALAGADDPFGAFTYFASVGFLMSFGGAAAYVSYRTHLMRVQRDLRGGTKTIERVHILRKQYMPQTSEYFFYIDSESKLSIEVSADDYTRFQRGDELTIEYTTHSRHYLGYS
jgi:hypothetical protein